MTKMAYFSSPFLLLLYFGTLQASIAHDPDYMVDFQGSAPYSTDGFVVKAQHSFSPGVIY